MSEIRKRRNSLLKSSISINSIRDSVSKFTEGLINSRNNASEIVKQTNESNKFKRTLIGNDNSYFEKRRENARRRQREDELESSTVQGVTKKQGNVVSRSTKGFLGRILDFFGIVLIGWFVTNLPGILKSIQGLIDRIRRAVSFLTNFVDSIGDFLVSIKTGIEQAIEKLPRLDLGLLKKQNEESIDKANNNLNRVRRDMLATVGIYNNPANAGLEDYSGDQLIITDLDEESKKKEDKEKEDPTKGKDDENVEGEKDAKEFNAVNSSKRETETQKDDDPNDQDFIRGIKDEKDFKDIKSAESQSKGETIENKDEENKIDKDNKDKDLSEITTIKSFLSSLGFGEGKKQSDDLSTDTQNKKDNSSQVSGAVSKIKQITSDMKGEFVKGETKKIKVVSNQKRNRDNLNASRRKRNQVIIIEKEVATKSSSGGIGAGGGKSKLDNIDFAKMNDSETMKKIQSIILNT